MMTEIQRRQFLAGSIAAAASLTTLGKTTVATAAEKKQHAEFYELRIYRCVNADRRQRTSDYLQNAFVPALVRSGASRVGVFLPLEEGSDHSIYTLIAYPSLDCFGDRNLALADDEQFQKAAAEYFAQPKNMPPYSRIENRLMRAFDGMPAMELPASTKAGKPRIFELRIYESHNEHKARRKVDMFNDGEIEIMRQAKLGPVFFGETLISHDLPNLTYMLSADDIESHAKHWDAFRAHPQWLRMKEMDKYQDTVSKITSVMLKPAKYSQI